MECYGTDKPDLRFGLQIKDVTAIVRDSGFEIFKNTLKASKPGLETVVFGIAVPRAEASRKDIDDLTARAKSDGASGLAYFRVGQNKLDSPIAKYFDQGIQKKLIEKLGASEGDLLLFVADKKQIALEVLGRLRLTVAKWKKWINPKDTHFSWVTDFPLFKYNPEENRWESQHHPFTSPHLEDWNTFQKSGDWGKIRSRAYDLVMNGCEVGSGSIRIHNAQIQREVFDAMGFRSQETEERFGFLLKAFKYGPPPHGGIALGIDRLVAMLLGKESIREVIAFPKTQKALCPLTDAPSLASARQLKELGIKVS